jgi:hypothetical protein
MYFNTAKEQQGNKDQFQWSALNQSLKRMYLHKQPGPPPSFIMKKSLRKRIGAN